MTENLINNNIDLLPISQLCYVDKLIRLKRRIKSRIDGLTKQGNLCRLYNRFEFFVYCEERFHNDLNILNSLYSRLDIYSVICNTPEEVYTDVYRLFKLFPDTIEEHSKKLLGVYSKPRKIHNNPVFNKFMELFRDGNIKSRVRDLKALLFWESKMRIDQGWYFVFNTLTVTDASLKGVFDARSSAFSDYVRSVDRSVAKSVAGSYRKARRLYNSDNVDSDYHFYFAVVERGSVTGRPHIHVIHMMRDLPVGSYDPNKGLDLPRNREISLFKKFWKYGTSTPIAVRFNNADAYGRDGWRWPVKSTPSGYKSLDITDPCAIISYVSKYVSKSYQSNIMKGDYFPWRIRKSQRLGQAFLTKIVNKLNENQLLTMMFQNGYRLKVNNYPLPKVKLKIMSLRRLMTLMTMKNCPKLFQLIKTLSPRENLLKLLSIAIRTSKPLSSLNAGDTRVLSFNALEGFNLSKVFEEVYFEVFGKVRMRYNVGSYTGV